MQHGALTPLGRQLRSVLANLCTVAGQSRAAGNHDLTTRSGILVAQRGYHGSTRRESDALSARGVLYLRRSNQVKDADRPKRSQGVNRIKRRVKRAYLSEAFKNIGKGDIAPPASGGTKRDISHWNVAKRHGRRQYEINKARHTTDQMRPLKQVRELSLERIIASYIEETATLGDPLQAPWHVKNEATTDEDPYLASRGWRAVDLNEWSDILAVTDVQLAVDRLAELVRSQGPSRVPIVVLTKLLQRPYISAPALRILLGVSWDILQYRSSFGRIYTSDNTIFIVFLRLLRHARVVWPAAIENTAELLLKSLPSARTAYKKNHEASLTHMLNSALRLLTMRTSVEPMHNTEAQEAAVVRILSFMSERRPQLQITREGFRAVIRIQLTMKKTPKEQEWGKLKALSWPPWKQDRTAMDAQVTPEYGVSRALSTLGGMREAGYGFLAWERSAQLLAGWDVDRTPTIQSRVLLGSGWGTYQSHDAEEWAARIIATRTAQEAWAAYLAYEERRLPPHELVHLAILEKLYGEEKRQREEQLKAALPRKKRRSPLLPGDTREVEPLPPSTHLYTYTSRPIPTVQSFFVQLRKQDHKLRGHALAFAVAHAASLEQGVEYLLSVRDTEPAISSLLSPTPSIAIREVPDYLFAAYIKLLCRFTNASLGRIYHHLAFDIPFFMVDIRILPGRFSYRQPIIFALHLLQLRGTVYRPAWNAVLRALNRQQGARALHSLKAVRSAAYLTYDSRIRQCHGHLIAYRLAQRTVAMLQQINVDLDVAGLQSLCINVESLTWNCWHTLHHESSIKVNDQQQSPEQALLLQEAVDILQTRKHTSWLKQQFWAMIGGTAPDSPGVGHSTNPPLPSQPHFLNTPGTAVLHAYIRALGWAGDFDGLLEIVKWMVRHEAVLKHARERDRNGEDMLRLSITAVRGFMERAWLASGTRTEEECGHGSDASVDDEPARESSPRILRVLEAAAPIEVLAEVRELVESVQAWQGWATDEEVAEYFADRRFRDLLGTMSPTK